MTDSIDDAEAAVDNAIVAAMVGITDAINTADPFASLGKLKRIVEIIAQFRNEALQNVPGFATQAEAVWVRDMARHVLPGGEFDV